MKNIFFTIALIATSYVQAQTTMSYDWIKSAGAGGVLSGKAIVKNGSDYFVAGVFSGTVTFPGQPSLSSAGGRDVFIAKYNSSGVCLDVERYGGAGHDDVSDMTLSGSDLFLAGVFNYHQVMKVGITLPAAYTSVDLGDVNVNAIEAYGSQVMIGGDCLLGNFPKFDGTFITLATSTSSTAFVARMTTSLHFTAAQMPYAYTGNSSVLQLACRNQCIYATGWFDHTIQPSNGGIITSSVGGGSKRDMFISSIYIPNLGLGTCLWSNDLKRGGSSESTLVGANNYDFGRSIVADANGIYVTGHLESVGSGANFAGTTYSGEGAFIAKFNYLSTSVGSLSWMQHVGGVDLIGMTITLDGLGSIYVAGNSTAGALVYAGGISIGKAKGFLIKHPTDNLSTGYVEPIDRREGPVGSLTPYSIVVNGCEVLYTGETNNIGTKTGNLSGLGNNGYFLTRFNRTNSISLNTSSCGGTPNVVNLITTAPGATAYSWSPSTNLSDPTIANPVFTSTSGSVTQTYTVTSTGGTCPSTSVVTVKTGPSSAGVANAGPNLTICPSSTYTLGTPGVAGLTYSWNWTTYLSSNTVAQPVLTTPSNISGFPLTYTLTVTDVCGSTSTDQVVISPDFTCRGRLANSSVNEVPVSLMPNPTNGLFSIQLPAIAPNTVTVITITDLYGRVVLHEQYLNTGSTVNYDLSAEPSGIYLILIERNGEREVHKLVLQH